MLAAAAAFVVVVVVVVVYCVVVTTFVFTAATAADYDHTPATLMSIVVDITAIRISSTDYCNFLFSSSVSISISVSAV